MNCPSCQGRLVAETLHRDWIGDGCEACGGVWIPSFLYAEWLLREGRRRPPRKAAAGSPEAERFCPECLGGLQTSLAGKGLKTRVENCPRCGGFWLDARQGRAIRGAEWETSLEAVFKTLWTRQREALRKQNDAAAAAASVGSPSPGASYNAISRRKEFHPIKTDFEGYLREFRRYADLPPIYKELLEFTGAFPCFDAQGEDTLWQTVVYDPARTAALNSKLSRTYSQLKTGDPVRIEHIYIERIDYCEFGNTKPFRIRVVNQFNDNYDHFYVKVPDASRIYGLELEHTLSPNWINYLVHHETLVEEHIAGIPGDVFIREQLGDRHLNKVRVAKEFVKFNERCFVRLLGDMRSYNYVVDITPDFEETQYRVRAIDFDQQSYEGERNMYLPQFFRENAPVVKLCTELLNYPTMQQYQTEERTLISRRVELARVRVDRLLRCMADDALSTPEKVGELREGLNEYHETRVFDSCRSMGDLVRVNLEVVLESDR